MKVLRHRTDMRDLLTDVVPASDRHFSALPQHGFRIHRSEVLLHVPIAEIRLDAGGDLQIVERETRDPLGPPIHLPLPRERVASFPVSPDGRSARLIADGVIRIDLSPLHDSIDMGLAEESRRQLAEINSESTLVNGRLVAADLRGLLAEEIRQHPDFLLLQPSLKQRIRWHRMRVTERRFAQPKKIFERFHLSMARREGCPTLRHRPVNVFAIDPA